MPEPILLARGEGHTITASGTKTIFKVKSSSTGGRFSMAEYVLPAEFPGPPPHVHQKFEHAWYVLEGTLQVALDKQTHRLSQGAFLFVPTGVVHTFSNPGAVEVRMLAIDTPGGLEPYYEELARAFPEGAQPRREVIAAIQSRYDTFPAS
jgi:mannose-6-phosphate isomerase-like protein (cupin superfamily)